VGFLRDRGSVPCYSTIESILDLRGALFVTGTPSLQRPGRLSLSDRGHNLRPEGRATWLRPCHFYLTVILPVRAF